MRNLIDPKLMPPTGFFYVDPDTRYMSEAGTLTGVIAMARTHRKGNSLDIPLNFAAIVEDFICMNNDPDFSVGEHQAAFNVPLTESWIRSSMDAQLHAYHKNGGGRVDPQVAERRAQICAHCEMNVRSPICFSCVGLDIMEEAFFKDNTAARKDLRVCKLNAVPNRTQVQLPAETLIDRKKEMPEACWYAAELAKRSIDEGH